MDNALRVQVVMGVSLVWCEEAKGNPSSHLGETSTFHGNAIGYRFMRMTPEALPSSILRRLSSTSQSHAAPCYALLRAAPAGGGGARGGRKEPGVSVAAGGGRCRGGGV